MKPYLLAPLCAAALLSGGCEHGTARHEVIGSTLRAPAYPLVTIDPYTSAWSMTDHLYDGSVKHWTGKDFPLIGVLKVDGIPYRFMGTEQVEMTPVVPTSQQGEWSGRYTTTEPSDRWLNPEFDDSAWKQDRGAFGTKVNEPTAQTDWTTEHIWVRRTFTLDEGLENRSVYLEFSNDDNAEFYINGILVHETGVTCNKNALVKLPDEAVRSLKKGGNLIAAHCWNPVANGLLDFGLLVQKEQHTLLEQTALQTGVDVQATQTHYTFTCGGVDLQLTFTAPFMPKEPELISRPINYISYTVTSNDNKAHDMELYLEASPRWALDQPCQESASERFEQDGLLFVKAGSKEQNILAKSGDDLRIDWGYFLLATDADKSTAAAIGPSKELRRAFVEGKPLSDTQNGRNGRANMAFIRKLGSTKGARGKWLIGYDDICSIQYFGENLRPYWNTDGTRTIIDEFRAANEQYDELIDRCYDFDRELIQMATKAGGRKYAELCALAYRQSFAAHKLVKAPDGELLFLSKENNSNGSIGTVDISYPSSPMYMYYNPELVKGTMNHIYDYSESGRWTKPFPAHDVGTYPLANGQTYGGDMPVEEGGNMLIMTAAVCAAEGHADYAKQHWQTLTTWTDYLVEKGLDPENQLCTDDFAGHFAHNANLSIKAIMGIAAYGRMAEMLGLEEVARSYTAKAREMAIQWEKMANDGDHYRLTFDKPGTWSQKYNLVWDKLLGLKIFPDSIAEKETACYLTRQNRYGLPLDSRETYTKTDWIIWTASLADDQKTFEAFVAPLYDFMNETLDRVPMSDWIYTDKPYRRGFMARAVVGGYYIRMLDLNNRPEQE